MSCPRSLLISTVIICSLNLLQGYGEVFLSCLLWQELSVIIGQGKETALDKQSEKHGKTSCFKDDAVTGQPGFCRVLILKRSGIHHRNQGFSMVQGTDQIQPALDIHHA